MLQASSSAASSVQACAPVGREPGERRPGAGAAGRPVASGPTPATLRSTVSTTRPSRDPLERVRHGQDGDRGAVLRGRREDGRRRAPATRCGRAPSWTSTIRSPVTAHRLQLVQRVERGEAGCHRLVPPRAARDHGDDALRQPRCGPHSARPGRPRSRRRSARRCRRRQARRSTRRAAADRRLDGPACRRRPSGCDAPAATTIASASGKISREAADRRPSPGPQSRRGWAKIIRPATVWRTRVTATSRSLSM